MTSEPASAPASARPPTELTWPARFRPLRPLGRGRFGEVWLAHDAERGLDLAVKRLLLSGSDAVRRFKREFRALADLQHPHLATLYELVRAGEDDWLLTMEHVRGRNPETAADWLAALPGVVAGLHALHQAGHLHRDVKASNVLLSERGGILLDFGLVGRVGERGELQGNLAGMAPEQVARRELGPASDFYALGATLFTVLVGRPPFEGRGAQVIADKLHRAPPSVASLAPELAADVPLLAAFADAALERDPLGREGALAPLFARLGVDTSEVSRRVFVGREAELRALDAALDEVARGATRHVRVQGPSAIGKSSLLEAWTPDRAGVLRYDGRCHALDGSDRRGLDEIVHALFPSAEGLEPREAAALARLFPELALAPATGSSTTATDAPADGPPTDVATELRLAAGAISRRLEARAEVTIITVDDAQWGDEVTGRLLALLALPSLLLVTVRREGAREGGLLAALDLSRPPERTLALGPLADDAVAQLARDLGGDAEGVAEVVRAAAGHPFVARELSMSRGRGGEHVDELVARRLDGLAAGAAGLLEVVALAGRPVPPALADAACARLGFRADFASTTALARARLVRTLFRAGEARLEVVHDVVARAGCAAAERRGTSAAIHAAFDDAMEELDDADLESRARHALGAGRPERARRFYARAAAEAARALRFDRAADLYARALALGPEPSARATWTRARAEALGQAGRHLEAAREFERARGGRPPSLADLDALDLARRRAEHLLHAGEMREGYEALAECLRAVDAPGLERSSVGRVLPSLLAHDLWLRSFVAPWRPGDAARGWSALVSAASRLAARLASARPSAERPSTTAVERARIELGLSAGLALTNVDSFRGAEQVLRSARLAARAGEPARFARAAGLAANYVATGGVRAVPRVEAMAALVLEEAARVRGAGSESEASYLDGLGVGARAVSAFHVGAYARGLELARASEAAFARTGAAMRERVSTQIYQVANLANLARYAELEVERRRLLEDSRARGDRFGATASTVGFGFVAWLARDEPEAARRALVEAMRAWGDVAFQIQHFFALLGHGRVDLYEGRAEDCLARLARARRPLAASLLWRMPFVRAQLRDLRARALLTRVPRGGLRARDERALERLAAALLREERPHRALGEVVAAGLAWHRGEDDEARRALRRARVAFVASGAADHAAAAALALERLGDSACATTSEAQEPARMFASLGWLPPAT